MNFILAPHPMVEPIYISLSLAPQFTHTYMLKFAELLEMHVRKSIFSVRTFTVQALWSKTWMEHNHLLVEVLRLTKYMILTYYQKWYKYTID